MQQSFPQKEADLLCIPGRMRDNEDALQTGWFCSFTEECQPQKSPFKLN